MTGEVDVVQHLMDLFLYFLASDELVHYGTCFYINCAWGI